jgi:hypothetical protein
MQACQVKKGEAAKKYRSMEEDKENNNNNVINELTQHEFTECSQLPFLPPIYSCNPCDEWRKRMHSVHFRDRCCVDRSTLSKRYQCKRITKGYGPIRIRVIQGIAPIPSASASEICMESKALSSNEYRERGLARETVTRLAEDKEKSFFLKEKKLLEDDLLETKKKLRSTQTMLSRSREHQSSLVKKSGKTKVVDPMVALCQSIDKVFSIHFPGKHSQTRAQLLIEALSSGLLFHGEGVALLQEMKRLYVRQIFKDWKVLKAFDCSSIGAFKTSTVKALHSILDEQFLLLHR